jgi:hypothetical protein
MRYYNIKINQYTTRPRSIRTKDGLITNPTDAQLAAEGILPVVEPTLGKYDRPGPGSEVDGQWVLTTIHATPDEIRAALIDEVYRIAQEKLNAATAQYSPAEMGQWPVMVQHAEAGDWAYFDAMATPGMTGQEYGQIVLQKDTELKTYFDAVIAARNTHKANIAALADTDLEGYDTSTNWP